MGHFAVSGVVLDPLVFAISFKLRSKPVPVWVLNVHMKKQTRRGDQPLQPSLGMLCVEVEKPRGKEAVLHLCGSQLYHRRA